MNLYVNDLIYVPHGGARLGKQVATVDYAGAIEVQIRRWHPKDRCFGRWEAVRRDTITELVPHTDRRFAAIRKYRESSR